jgi:hypothetical protein
VIECVTQFGGSKLRNGVSVVAMLLVVLGVMLCVPDTARANEGQRASAQMSDDAQADASVPQTQNHAGPGMDVAFADFDGDRRPDSAHVQRGRAAAGGQSYSIDFRFSSTDQPAQMDVVAPDGGLRIEARDVNGDNAVDLVLTTAWFREPVAILLNDGHGKFSHAEPSTYPNAFNRPASTFNSSDYEPYIPFAITTQSNFVLATAQTAAYQPAPASRGVVSPSQGFRAGPAIAGHSGRAPPTSLHISA